MPVSCLRQLLLHELLRVPGRGEVHVRPDCMNNIGGGRISIPPLELTGG